ncbi:hypothetical protein [Nitrosovibrio tenuis]|uniref:hypothetical protein n=1 Tax=Nitrosovibrio tenuis TaxID=1233 RepID=UPI001FE1F5D3|nr:hypothetical protein [Nitrosovibrio tenuis]
MDQSNLPGAAGVAGAADAGAVVGATVVLPERGGSDDLFPAGAGSAAKACNARPSVPALRQKLQNFRNGRGDGPCDRCVAESVFDPALGA